MLTAPAERVNGQIFNVGSEANNYQLGPLAEIVVATMPKPVEIEWYGDADNRSYRVSFDKIESLGWKAQRRAEDGVREIVAKLDSGELDKSSETITLDWYKNLVKWHAIIRQVEMYGGIFDIDGPIAHSEAAE
jgi:dTDP-D-glucose 4,6-dehydratase